MKYIDTDNYSGILRNKSILLKEKKILIARISGSEQEKDLSLPVNAGGYGRIRHFRYNEHSDWSTNPLPILPAAKALGKSPDSLLAAQVFQNSACNWRCWYCYVDFDRLSADRKNSEFFTADELVDLYLDQKNPPDMIDLSGGQPDLTPEWIVWMMEAIEKRGLSDRIFLWSDDNLSNYYFWEFLTADQIKYIVRYPRYARVGCFKGYNDDSFSFNTLAHPTIYKRQFDIFKRLLSEGVDMYAYVTLTAQPDPELHSHMETFVDRLQNIHNNLPLRTVPLKIEVFTPTSGRMEERQFIASQYQRDVHEAWTEELQKRYSKRDLSQRICDVSLR